MGKSKTSICSNCQCEDDIPHMILHCHQFSEIRQKFTSDLLKLNNNLGKYLTNDQIMIVTFLDPESPSLPSDVSDGWTDLSQVYQLCRDFCWNIHAKREKNNSMQNHKKSIEETRK